MSDTRTIIKEVPNGVFYSDDTFLLKNVRASYPHLDKPFVMQNKKNEGEPKYQLQALIPKTAEYQPLISTIQRKIALVLREAKIPDLADDKKCFRDGDTLGKAEAKEHWRFNASEVNPPALRGRGRDPRTGLAPVIANEEARKEFYGGCWVNVMVRLWVQNNIWGKRVNANLLAVQKVRDDEPFGEGRISNEVVDESFEVIEDDDSGYEELADSSYVLDL